MGATHNTLSQYTHDHLSRYPNDAMLADYGPTAPKTLHVMGLDFEYKAAIRGYESVTIKREWNGIGTLTVMINSDITNVGLIKEDDLLWFDNEYNKVFIVEKIEDSLTGNSTTYTFTASHINTFIRDYITIPPLGQDQDVRTGTREAIVRAWVEENVITPSDTDRSQYPIVLGAYGAAGSVITEQTRLKNLYDEISRVLSTEGLGWIVELDGPNHQFIFKVLQGVDRTESQSVNSRILFGLKYGNMASYRKVKDAQGARTVAFVGGQGEGAERAIVEVNMSGTGRRKETFIDARDAENTDELIERGYQSLTELTSVDAFEFETLNRQFTYEVDYDLGDYVTVVVDRATTQNLQIRKVTEVYERGNITVTPEFGKPERTISGVFNAVTSRIAKLETTESGINKVLLINQTGEVSVKGKLVHVSGVENMSVELGVVDRPDIIGVIYESGVPIGEPMWVVYSGVADVYFSGSTTRGYLARSPLSLDASPVAGQAINEPLPSAPFGTDKHFCEIGHVLESRTGAGLAKCMLHFN